MIFKAPLLTVYFRFTLITSALLIVGCSYLQPQTDNNHPAENTENLAQVSEASSEQFDYVSDLFPLPTNAKSIDNYKPAEELDLIQRAVKNFSWPDYSEREQVKYWIDRYLSSQEEFEAILARGEPYLFHILTQLEQQNFPTELAFLPYVESGFRPEAASWIGAAGLWQFMPATGRAFSLEQDWWLDERRSVDKSTEAAISYLDYLYNYFDQDWFMALAAYNTGEGNLRKVRGSDEDAVFWDLSLNSETASYVPKLLAVVHLIKNADELDLNLPEWRNQPYFEVFESEQQFDLESVASHLQIDKEKLLRINAHYPQAITPPNQTARLLLPVGMSTNLSEIVDTLPEVTGPSWAHYRVRNGDNLSLIADRMGVSLRAVIEANQLKSNLIHPGDDLLIPSPKTVAPNPVISGSVAMVRPGDSVWLIARRYGVSTDALLAANNLTSSDFIHSGQTLKLPNLSEGDTQLTHEVKNGDSLYDIALLYGVRLNELRRWNSLGNSSLIRPGDQLTIWQAID